MNSYKICSERVTSYWCIDHVILCYHGVRHRYSLVWSLFIIILVVFVCLLSYKYNTKYANQISSTTHTDMSSSIAMLRSRSASSDCWGTFWICFASCKWTCAKFIYQKFVECTVRVLIVTYFATGLSTAISCTVNLLRLYTTQPKMSKPVIWPEMEILF